VRKHNHTTTIDLATLLHIADIIQIDNLDALGFNFKDNLRAIQIKRYNHVCIWVRVHKAPSLNNAKDITKIKIKDPVCYISKTDFFFKL